MSVKDFTVAGERVKLACLPFTVGGVDHDVPVMNLKTQRHAMKTVLPLLGGDQDAQWGAWLETIECRMGDIDGNTLTAERINLLLAGQDETAAFYAQLIEWGILSGILKRPGEPTPGPEAQTPAT